MVRRKSRKKPILRKRAVSKQVPAKFNYGPINYLPTELLSHIFSFLPYKDKITAERSCKRFKEVIESIPWNIHEKVTVNVSFGLCTKFFTFLRRHGSRIKRLEFQKHTCFNEHCMASCPNVENVKFSEMSLDYHSTKFVHQYWSRIKMLTFFSCDIDMLELNNFLYGCPNIQYLHLENCNELISMVNPFIQLVNLRVLKLINLEELDMFYLMCPNLEVFVIDACPEVSHRDLNKFLEEVGHSLTELTILRSWFNVDIIKNGLCCCTNLREAKFDDYLSCNTTVECLARGCNKTLRILEFTEANVDSFDPLLRCLSLSSFTIQYAEDTFSHDLIPFLIKHPSLSFIHVETTIYFNFSTVLELFRNCKKLTKLVIGRFDPHNIFDFGCEIWDCGCFYCDHSGCNLHCEKNEFNSEFKINVGGYGILCFNLYEQLLKIVP